MLILEAGPATGTTWDGYQDNVEQYQSSSIKVQNAPYGTPADAPSPNVLDICKLAERTAV